MLSPLLAARRSSSSAAAYRLVVARRAPRVQPCDLLGLDLVRHGHDRVFAGGQRRRLGFDEAVDADDDLLVALDCLEPRGVALDELALHVAHLDRGDGAAELLDVIELSQRRALEFLDLVL